MADIQRIEVGFAASSSEEGFGEPTLAADLDLGACPYSACELAANHPGDHQLAPRVPIDLDALDDLPF